MKCFNFVNKLVDRYKNRKIDAIIHCGDVVSFNLFDNLKVLSNNIYYVKGNNDKFDFQTIEDLKRKGILYSHAPFEFEIEQYGNFVIMHEPYYIEEYKKKKYIDFILYGHTHKQQLENYKNKIILNPGALGKFRNFKSQYAIIEEGNNIILKEDLDV